MSNQPVQHNLRCWPVYFRDITNGNKTFEVRKYDRPFKVGDVIDLQEWDEGAQEYTGETWMVKIIYILPGGRFGIEKDYCVLGIEPVDNE